MQTDVILLTGIDLGVSTVDQQEILGSVGRTEDGREFRYAQMGATNVTAGQVLSTPATGANFLGLAVAAAAPIGATQVVLTLAGTATTYNEFTQGALDVISGTGAGATYKIKGVINQNTATGAVTVGLIEPLRIALDTTSVVNLTPCQWLAVTSQVSVGSGAANPRLAGVATAPITASYYGWIQVEGRAMVIDDGAAAIYRGLVVILSSTTAGDVQLASGTSDADKQPVGNALESPATQTAGLMFPCYLTIL